jgi:hypothetical protein
MDEREITRFGKNCFQEPDQSRTGYRLTDPRGYNRPRGRQILALRLKKPALGKKNLHILLESATLKEIEEFDLVFSLVLACRY